MRFLSLFPLLFLALSACAPRAEAPYIMTVNGSIPATAMGVSLIHEHVLVDFVGADSIHPGRWDREEAARVILPYLLAARQHGCTTLVECTPAYLGRDPLLLKALSDSAGVHILTNTGYYGAGSNKYLPSHAHSESSNQLAARWIDEWKNGIEGSGIRPGFIKISVEFGPVSDLHAKLAEAAAKTHLQTGLTIASHTGLKEPAFTQLEILRREGVSPEAFIWVHAQAEKDLAAHVEAARQGGWISLDGVNEENTADYSAMLQNLKANGLLHRALISHDAGWYRPGEPGGGDFRGYAAVFEQLLPQLAADGFTHSDVQRILVENPARAFAVRVRKTDKS